MGVYTGGRLLSVACCVVANGVFSEMMYHTDRQRWLRKLRYLGKTLLYIGKSNLWLGEIELIFLPLTVCLSKRQINSLLQSWQKLIISANTSRFILT